jgi:hypothetical protein
MAKVTIRFKSRYPLMGAMREIGEVFIDGTCPIDEITPDKLVNTIRNADIAIEISKDEAENNHTGNGAVPRGRSGRNKKP